ncbi:hypothetical protein D3C76_736500 [compost metagenome]
MLDLAGGDHADVDAHVRAAVLELGKRMGDAHVRQGHQVIGQADVQLAAQVLVQPVDLGTEALQGTEQLQGRMVDLAAFLGQRKTGTAALAQAQAQALLQVVHLLADGRAADPEYVLGCREAAALDDAAVDLQQANVKIADLSEWVGASAH